MTREKFQRIKVAFIVAAILLAVFLFAVLIYQWASIGVLERRKSELIKEISEISEILEKKEGNLDYYESVLYKEMAARELGYVKPGEEPQTK